MKSLSINFYFWISIIKLTYDFINIFNRYLKITSNIYNLTVEFFIFLNCLCKLGLYLQQRVKSLVVFIEPNLTFETFFEIWLIIVGITALVDCLGPYVLNGRNIVIGKPNE